MRRTKISPSIDFSSFKKTVKKGRKYHKKQQALEHLLLSSLVTCAKWSHCILNALMGH